MRFFLVLCAFAFSLAQAEAIDARSVRQIVHDGLPRVLSHQRIDSYMPDVTLEQTINEFMGPSQEFLYDQSPYPLLGMCRPHSCDEKLGVIVDRNAGTVLGVAIHHFHCHRTNGTIDALPRSKRHVQCDKLATNTIILFKRTKEVPAVQVLTLQRLTDWAHTKGPGQDEVRILAVQ